MKIIELSDSSYARLVKRVRSFEDTAEDVILRLLEIAESQDVRSEDQVFTVKEKVKKRSERREQFLHYIYPDLPDLGFTSIRKSEVSGKLFRAKSWNSLLQELLRQALNSETISIEEIEAIAPINVKRGRVTTKGFRFVAGTDISYQGLDANRAALAAFLIANELGSKVNIEFAWRLNEKAEFPGKSATLSN